MGIRRWNSVFDPPYRATASLYVCDLPSSTARFSAEERISVRLRQTQTANDRRDGGRRCSIILSPPVQFSCTFSTKGTIQCPCFANYALPLSSRQHNSARQRALGWCPFAEKVRENYTGWKMTHRAIPSATPSSAAWSAATHRFPLLCAQTTGGRREVAGVKLSHRFVLRATHAVLAADAHGTRLHTHRPDHCHLLAEHGRGPREIVCRCGAKQLSLVVHHLALS